MSTLAEIRTDVRERIGEDTADFFTDAEVDRAINLGLTKFSNEELWPWLFTEWATTISEGVDTIELPENVSIHRAFNLSIFGSDLYRGRQLERVEPIAGFRIRHAYDSATRAPIYYYLTSASRDDASSVYVVRLVPVPDIDYDLEAQYLRVPEPLDSADDVPDLPDEFHPAIPAWAARHLFLKEMDISQKAQEQYQLYLEVLVDARKTLEPHGDEVVAWSRETPLKRVKGLGSVLDRLPSTLGQ